MFKKKSIGITILIIMLISAVSMQIVYAQNSNENTSFFYVSKNELKDGEKLEMIIDISKIQYENFKFSLSSDLNVKNILLNEESEKEEIDVDVNEEENTFEITIDKSKLNEEKIILYYNISGDIKAENEINLKGKITELSNKEEILENTEEEDIKVTIMKNNEETSTPPNDNKEDENNNQGNNNNQENNNSNSNNKPSSGNENNMNGSLNSSGSINNNGENQNGQMNSQNGQMVFQNSGMNLQSEEGNFQNSGINNSLNEGNNKMVVGNENSSGVMNGQNGGAAEVVTYKGSRNNYLSSLTVSDNTFSPQFLKENTTYFMTVKNDVTSLSVNAEAEDSTSTVKIYGNSDLSIGENKILISVTAENGNVRTYRIYVTREE